jgi:hypothetical protein
MDNQKEVKTMNVGTTSCLVAAVLGASMGGAMAKTSSASLQDITITVEDMNPNDGIAPGFTFSGFQSVFASAVAADTPQPVSDFWSETEWVPRSVDVQDGSTFAQASVGEGFMSTSGQGPGFYTGRVIKSANFELTPFTRLVFTGVMTLSTSINDLPCSAPGACEISDANFGAWVGPSAFPILVVEAFANKFDPSESRTEQLHITFENTFGHTRDFTVQMHAVVGGGVGPVPEPQTYALMLLGLGALGIVSRRRRSG